MGRMPRQYGTQEIDGKLSVMAIMEICMQSIKVPTLVICGDKDPYLNYDRVDSVLNYLPDGSALEVIKGASHVAFIEKPYYHDFQERVKDFLFK